MAKETPVPTRVGVAVAIPANLPLPPAEGANFFHFTVVGEEVQLLVGSINLLRIHEAKGKTEPTTVVPEITHRFLLSPLGFKSLRTQLLEIEKAAPKSDVGMGARVG